jgi:hypothetical protein
LQLQHGNVKRDIYFWGALTRDAFPFSFFCDKLPLVSIITKRKTMASYRDSLREVAKSLEELRDDLHEFSGVLENIADKVYELEEENKKLKSNS